MAQSFTNYPALTDFQTPAVTLVEQNGTTFNVQLSPLLSNLLSGGAVTEDAIAPGAVTTNAILDGSITGAKLAAGSITGANLATGSVNGSVLTVNSVPGSAIGTGTITGTNIQSGSVNASVLVPNTVTSYQLADGCVTNGKLAVGSVTNSTIADGSVNGNKIAPASIGGTQLQLNSVSGANLLFGTVALSNLTPDLQTQLSALPQDFNYTGTQTISSGSTSIWTFTAPYTGWYHAFGWGSGVISSGYYLEAALISTTTAQAPYNTIQGGYYSGVVRPFVQTTIGLSAGQTLILQINTNVTVSVNWAMRVVQFR